MNPMHRVEQDRYAVILAGGDASRLMPLSRRITGGPVPKQFCPIIGEHSNGVCQLVEKHSASRHGAERL